MHAETQVGACNHVDRIDPAVIRPGRFDILLPMPMPDAATIQGILARHLRGEMAAHDLDTMARQCVGRSAAAIDAALRAEARHEGGTLTLATLRRHLGIETDPRHHALDRRAAFHECGHAIAGAALRLGTITRVVLTTAGGETHRTVGASEGLPEDLEAELAYVLAGRAAERVMLGTASGGAGGDRTSDLAQATRIALALDTTLGLGASGLVWHDAPARDLLADPKRHARVRRRLQAAEDRAFGILEANRSLLRDMATDLLRQRELQGPALAAWLDRVTPEQTPRQQQGDQDGPGATPPADPSHLSATAIRHRTDPASGTASDMPGEEGDAERSAACEMPAEKDRDTDPERPQESSVDESGIAAQENDAQV